MMANSIKHNVAHASAEPVKTSRDGWSSSMTVVGPGGSSPCTRCMWTSRS